MPQGSSAVRPTNSLYLVTLVRPHCSWSHCCIHIFSTCLLNDRSDNGIGQQLEINGIRMDYTEIRICKLLRSLRYEPVKRVKVQKWQRIPSRVVSTYERCLFVCLLAYLFVYLCQSVSQSVS